ncbi:MAG: methionyl-tRNA formyltransferase [Bacteroidia bacterium]|nr:methionyl-tRNA formyltransferase [Bacteroidia bacterium]NNK69297.1 methionyl-tRNA formyltransferase [Flavobacteriaceae bacterium]NNL79235.1 methionyl-tRNA formyltransferase [Flavobacteriaceae bacterium]
MKRNLRIVFMGTPEFAVPSLDALIRAGYNVVGVITAPDKPAGRGRKLRKSAVKQYAMDHGLTVLQPGKLRNESFLKALKALDPNLQVVVAFRMLPRVIWELPKYGTFNLHASLLPQYRGAAPINWAIINGDIETGVSTFFIDEKIDTGEMILQRPTSIDPDESAGSLHDRLMEMGSKLLVETVGLIEEGIAERKPQQDHSDLKAAPKLNPDNCRIDWNKPVVVIHNLIRGLSPYPAAWTMLQNGEDQLRVKVYQSEIITERHDLENGTIVSDGSNLKIACKNGFIGIKKIQLPGKRKMTVKDLLNGFSFDDNAKML